MSNYFENISYLMIETNSSCNLKCPTCNRERLKELGMRADKYLSLDEFKHNLSYFAKCPLEIIKIEGISEPMLHREFDYLAGEVKRAHPNSFVIIATNCQYRLEGTRFLETLPLVDMIYLSIDGTEEIYEKARAGSTWPKLLKFMEDLKRTTSPKDRQEKLFINFTATNSNYKELPKIYEMKSEYGLAGVRINLAQDWNEDKKNENDFPKEMLDYLRQYKVDIKGSSPWKYDQCFWPNSGAVLDVYGNLRQCIINTSQNPLMNIHEESIADFYNKSKHYTKTREALECNNPTKECVNCDYHNLTPHLNEIFENEPSPNPPRTFKRFKAHKP